MVLSLATELPEPLPDTVTSVAPEAAGPDPIAAAMRAMRGRWLVAAATAAVLGLTLAVLGFIFGVQLFQTQAILRVYPQESNILYATGNGSVLKTFNSFVKAEASYVTSHPVMSRAVETLAATGVGLGQDLKVSDLVGSIGVKRNDSLIILTTKSRDASFAKAKLDAVVSGYFDLKSEAEKARSSFRLKELRQREGELSSRLASLRIQQLEVGGEFGNDTIVKAHIEKIAQIEALTARRSQVAATLAKLEAKTSGAPVDVSDQKIMRAILLDRGLADLNFDRVKKLAELANLRSRIGEKMPSLLHKREEIAVLETAIAERREQIRILAQTGALTDTTENGAESSLAEIRELYDKVGDQLAGARREARDLNRRRVELNAISKDNEENQKFLVETRRALEVIRLESGRALPGYTVLMSPPSQPVDPSNDTRKLLAAGGLAAGALAGLAVALALGFSEGRMRYAETLAPYIHQLPVVQVTSAGLEDAFAADKLRNELQLLPLRGPRPADRPPVLAVTRTDPGTTGSLSLALAESYARARMRTLYIDAGLEFGCDADSRPGWRELLANLPAECIEADTNSTLFLLPPGHSSEIRDETISIRAIRNALDHVSEGFDVVVVSAGSLEDRLASHFILSVADVAIATLLPSDRRKNLFRHLERLGSLPRHGSVAVVRKALAGDPWANICS
jgi:uncharacterized protein involved in exopolysaccharide biosynthesis